jgi:hypothetical protein
MKVEWNTAQTAVVRNLLIHGWPALSRGDRSIIMHLLDTPESAATTVSGSAHAEFWESMIALGWAERRQPGFPLPYGSPIRVFAFNAEGLALFPAFVKRFNLLSVVVHEEQPEIRAMLRQHFNEVSAEVLLFSWSALAKQVPVKRTRVQANEWNHYIAATWEAAWVKNRRGSIKVTVQAFLHAGHHNPIFIESKVVRKSALASLLFGSR